MLIEGIILQFAYPVSTIFFTSKPIGCGWSIQRGKKMKNRQISILRLLILMALALIGYRLWLTADRGAGAEGAQKVGAPLPAMRGRPAIEHLEQSGLYNSLSAAVTAARYGVEERKSG